MPTSLYLNKFFLVCKLGNISLRGAVVYFLSILFFNLSEEHFLYLNQVSYSLTIPSHLVCQVNQSTKVLTH